QRSRSATPGLSGNLRRPRGQGVPAALLASLSGYGRSPALERLLRQVQPIAARLAVVYRELHPQADYDTFREFLESHVRVPQSPERIERLYRTYAPGSYNLNDQGYIAKVHPL